MLLQEHRPERPGSGIDNQRWLSSVRRALAQGLGVGAVSGTLFLGALLPPAPPDIDDLLRSLVTTGRLVQVEAAAPSETPSGEEAPAALPVEEVAPSEPAPAPDVAPQAPVPSVAEMNRPSPDSQPAAPSVAGMYPLPKWVRTLGATDLWSESGDAATSLLSLPDQSLLQITGERENGRAPVYYEDFGPGGRKLAGWVKLEALQPTAAVSRVTPSSRGGARPASESLVPERFIASMLAGAQESERETGVPTSVTLAQAALESDWGRSLLSLKGQNYFGIKALSGPGPAGVIRMDTWEVFGGKNVVVEDAFKAYNNAMESILDHGRFLADNPRYAAAFKALDPREFARRIHNAGYATDPGYSDKLIGLMDKLGLYRYDLKALVP